MINVKGDDDDDDSDNNNILITANGRVIILYNNITYLNMSIYNIKFSFHCGDDVFFLVEVCFFWNGSSTSITQYGSKHPVADMETKKTGHKTKMKLQLVAGWTDLRHLDVKTWVIKKIIIKYIIYATTYIHVYHCKLYCVYLNFDSCW